MQWAYLPDTIAPLLSFHFKHNVSAYLILFDVGIHAQLVIVHESVAGHNPDESTWVLMDI